MSLALQGDPDIMVSQIDSEVFRHQIQLESGKFDWFVTAGATYSLFDPPNIAIDPAVGLDPSGLQQADSSIAEYQVGVTRAFGVGLEATARQRNAHTDVDGRRENPIYTPSLGVDLRQPLLRGLGVAVQNAPIDIARHRWHEAQARLRARVDALVLETIRTYWECVFARGDHDAKKSAVAHAQTLLDRQTKELERGAHPSTLFAAQSGLAEREEEALVAEQRLADRRDALFALVRPDAAEGSWDVPILVVKAPPTVRLTGSIDVAAAIATALEERPELTALEALSQQAGLEVMLRENQLLPALDAVGTFEVLGLGEDAAEGYEDLFTGGGYNVAVGLSLNLPAENRAGRAALHQAKNQRDRTEFIRDSQHRAIHREVRAAARALSISARRIEQGTIATKAAEGALELMTNRFEAGRVFEQEVLLAAATLTDAQSNLLRAKVDAVLAHVEFLSAQGILLHELGVKLTDGSTGSDR
ncbi:MAG: TolC family protein [Planctomycetota bacterium]